MTLHGISLRLSVTDKCQLHCRYCRPERTVDSHSIQNPLASEELISMVRSLHSAVGIAKLRFTGGEPLLRNDLPKIIEDCAGIGIEDIALTTNGLLLDDRAWKLKTAGLRRVNVSLDSLNPATYADITRGGDLTKVIKGIETATACGLRPLKLNTVVMRDINFHEVADMLEFAMKTGCHVRFLELMPIGVAASDFESLFVSSETVRRTLEERFEFMPMFREAGGTSRDFLATDASGAQTVCGFISPSSQPFCGDCNRFRLTADGRLLGCLAHDGGLDLRRWLYSDENGIRAALAEAFDMKRRGHDLSCQKDMVRIGG